MVSRSKVNAAFNAGLLIALLAAGVVHAQGNTYRYTDDRGNIVFGSTVPPQFVKNGYDVLNERGVVIQTVPRALTPEELAAQEAVRAQQQAEEAKLREQQERDNLLLRLYRSPDEIARKRDERVTLIEGQLTALTAALTKVEAEVASLQQNVESFTRQNQEAPAQTVETLRIQQDEMNRLLTQRTRLQTDRDTAIADADRDMKRLAELMGLPEEPAAQ